jgi:hypothetical protein
MFGGHQVVSMTEETAIPPDMLYRWQKVISNIILLRIKLVS